MWELLHSTAPYVQREGRLERHPCFGRFCRQAPLTFVLLTLACLSELPPDRLPFDTITAVLADLCEEMASGRYTDSVGNEQVGDVSEHSLHGPTLLSDPSSPAGHHAAGAAACGAADPAAERC